MSGTPRERARAQTMREIIEIAREQLAERGAAALSLRAIARDLGVVSSAVYRYVKSRDELLTLLIVEGYNALGDAVDDALADVPAEQYRRRFRTVGRAVRAWALTEPAMYSLLFGSPVPGYAAPQEQTTAPGTRVARTLLGIVADAYAAGHTCARELEPPPSAALAAGFDGIREQFDMSVPDATLSTGVAVWAALFGLVSFESFGQYGPDGIGDPGVLFEQHLTLLADQFGLPT